MKIINYFSKKERTKRQYLKAKNLHEWKVKQSFK